MVRVVVVVVVVAVGVVGLVELAIKVTLIRPIAEHSGLKVAALAKSDEKECPIKGSRCPMGVLNRLI